MTQSKISSFFSKRREASANMDLDVTGDRRGNETSSPSLCTPEGKGTRRQAALKLWNSFTVVTFNCGSLSELRTHQIIRELEQHKISAATILGTRNSFAGDRTIGNYRFYYAVTRLISMQGSSW